MIHYRVLTETHVINKTGEKKVDSNVKLFSKEHPIEARKEALESAKSFLEVLIDRKKITGDKLVAKRMSDSSYEKGIIFYNLHIDWYTEKDIEEIKELAEDIEGRNKDFERTDFILNGIDSTVFGPDFVSLEKELKLYKKNGYSTKGLEVIYEAYNDATEEMKQYNIIDTPFIYDTIVNIEGETTEEDYKPTSEIAGTGEDQIEDYKNEIKQLISKILTIGESKTIEFKSTLSYCLKTKQRSKDVEYAIVKTINAFMNHEGGFLFIGITDNKEIIGLDHDYSLYKGDNPKDELLKKLDNLVIHYLGKSSLSDISGRFYKFGQKDILSIKIDRSPEPVFIKSIKPNKTFDFFIRGNASSVPLNMKEAFDHIVKQWKYKKRD